MNPLKVLHLFNDYLPQTENWSYRLLKNTPDVQIFIGAKAYLKNNFYHPDFTFAELPGGQLTSFYSSLAEKPFPGVIQKALVKGLQFLSPGLEQELLQFAQSHQIDVIHAHFADVAWSFKNIAAQLKKPLVVSFYGWDYERLPFTQPIYKSRYQELFKTAAAIICEGAHGANIIEKMGCPPEKIKIVALGVNTAEIPFHQRSKPKNELHLLQLATFTEKKGHLYALQAFEKALKTCPNMTLTLRGGEAQAEIKRSLVDFVKSRGLEEQVNIKGPLDYSRIYEYLKNFQVFIHPSCYAADRDCEGGAPIVLLDAQATGMPVIASRHCDIPAEVLDQKTGLLAEEKKVEELVRHLQRFYAMDDAEYQQFAQAARAHVLTHFDSALNAIALKKVYDTLG